MSRFLSIALVLALAAGLYFWFNPGKDNTSPNVPITDSQGDISDVTTWHEYIAPSGQFKVLLPSIPHHATENIADPTTKEMRNYHIFVAQKGEGTMYSITSITFPKETSAPLSEDFLESYITQMLSSNPKNSIKNLKLNPYRNGKAIDFDVENSEAVVHGKAFLDSKTLYVLSVTSKPEMHNPREYDFFLNSFQLMPTFAPKKG